MKKYKKISFPLSNSTKSYRFPKYKIYKFLLEESLYTAAWENRSNFKTSIKNSKTSEKVHFLLMKQVVRKLRFPKDNNENLVVPYNKSFQSKWNTLYQFLLEPISFLLLSLYEKRKKQSSFFSENTKISSSIHSSLAFIEKKWQTGFSIMEGNIVCTLHPEIYLRILRKYIKDVSFFHLLRKILHLYISLFPFPIASLMFYKQQNFNIVLWNWYASEFDYFVFTETSTFSTKRGHKNQINTNDFSTFQKFRHWLPPFSETKLSFYEEHLNKEGIQITEQLKNHYKEPYFCEYRSCQYIRFKNGWLLNKQAKPKAIEKFKQRCLNYWKFRVGHRSILPNIKLIFLGNSCFFLGYFLKKKIVNRLVEIRINIVLTKYLKIQTLSIYSPISLIIQILSKYNFCTTNGFPISKAEWSTLTDFEIVKKFQNLRNNLISYHSGSANRKTLLCFQHILSYSCAKTLACKHKTNLRNIWKRYGSNITVKSSSYSTLFRITFNKIYVLNEKTRSWNLSLKKPDFFTLALEKQFLL